MVMSELAIHFSILISKGSDGSLSDFLFRIALRIRASSKAMTRFFSGAVESITASSTMSV